MGYLIVTKKNSYLFLDGRYITAARNSKNIKNDVELVHFGKIKELQRYADNKFLELGAEKISFDTIIASGVNGSMPHAVPTDKIINEGELVTIDMGCYFNGYCSDQTRTIAMTSE
ncbi:hypothetical protein FQA39_LY12902 [Lamprigera yunnana]|nr:hypothetical protein FQA39_LY12902 [Lamprigera yunnana]